MTTEIKIRASSIDRARICPGYLSTESTRHDSPDMQLGRLKHEILAAYWVGASSYEIPADLAEWFIAFKKWFEESNPGLCAFTNRAAEVGAECFGNGWKLTGTCDAIGFDDKGRKAVADWKTGGCWSLPQMDEHFQMFAYLVLQDARIVARVQTDNKRAEALALDDVQFQAAREMVFSACDDIAARAGTFNPGPHCEDCPARFNCESFLSHADKLIVRPYSGGPLVSHEQVVACLLAIPAAEKIVEAAKDAVKEYVKARGPIVHGGKEYGPGAPTKSRKPLSFDDARECLSESALQSLLSEGVFAEVERAGAWRWRKAASK